jgi:non-specific serine/threonine protein kinase
VAEEEAPKDISSPKSWVPFSTSIRILSFFTLELIEGDMDEEGSFAGNVQKLELSRYVETEGYSEEDKSLLQLVRKAAGCGDQQIRQPQLAVCRLWENIFTTKMMTARRNIADCRIPVAKAEKAVYRICRERRRLY